MILFVWIRLLKKREKMEANKVVRSHKRSMMKKIRKVIIIQLFNNKRSRKYKKNRK
jgi:hypothetical protein